MAALALRAPAPLPISRAADDVDQHLDTARRLFEAAHGKLAWMREQGLYAEELEWAAAAAEDALSDLRGLIAKRAEG